MATKRDPRRSALGRLLSLSAAVWVAGTGMLSMVASACATAAKYGGPPPESTVSPEAEKYGGPRPEPSQASPETPASATSAAAATTNEPPPVVAKYGGPPPPPQVDKYGGPQPPPQPTRALKYGGPPLR